MLRHIRYFQTVVRLNSFTKAAEECFISQSAISQYIKALEKRLGVTLIERHNRYFNLTPAGEFFYQRSQQLLLDFDALKKETIKIAQNNQPILSLGYLKGYGGLEFQQALALFTKKYPDLEIEYKSGTHEQLFELLKTNKIDLILSDQRRAFSQEYLNKSIKILPSFIEISSQNPLSQKSSVSTAELCDLACILVAPKAEQKTESTYYRDIYGIKSNILFAENLEEARLMVISHKGYLPIEGGSIPPNFEGFINRVELCHNNKPITRNYCIFAKADNKNKYIEEFIQLLTKAFNLSFT